eukprot:11490914-Alexandrium_andersonii.AAC.1
MPQTKPELVNLIEDWHVPTPDRPASMTVADLQEILFAYDRNLAEGKEVGALAKEGRATVTFREKHNGDTFRDVYEQDPDFCEWLIEKA